MIKSTNEIILAAQVKLRYFGASLTELINVKYNTINAKVDNIGNVIINNRWLTEEDKLDLLVWLRDNSVLGALNNLHFVIKMNAGNDVNGNPRRCYVVYDTSGNKVDCIDEGYRGINAMCDVYHNYRMIECVDVSAKRYKDEVKFFSKTEYKTYSKFNF